MSNALKKIDPIINDLIAQEAQRQETDLDLIASENYTPQAVLEATGSVLTNKYAEGYPGKRYYAGCRFVDEVENIAIERCKQLFGAEHANVQPHAGSQANMAVYAALLQPGDTVMGMSLAEGGHLTHGHAVNFSGTMYRAVQYKVNRDTELLDYDEIERLVHEHKPKLIIAGASAYSRHIDFARFAAIARSVNARFMVDMAHIAGLVAAGVHPNPFPHADVVTSTTHKTLRGPRSGLILCKKEFAERIDKAIMPGTQGGPFMHVIAAKAVAFHLALQPEFVAYQKQVIVNAQHMAAAAIARDYRVVTGGTDNHLFVLDLRNKNITGRDAQRLLERAGIIVSSSCIPFDPQKPWITSGIRIGSPAMTTRGMQEKEAEQIIAWCDELITDRSDASVQKIAEQIRQLCAQFPVYK
jgi:glycine hydroxymethyltransferase